MKLKLKDISKIKTGVYSRSQPNPEVYCFQGRDFDVYRNLISSIEPTISWEPNLQKHLLDKGDVIIAAKGYDYFAFTYNKEVEPAVASSMFIVVHKIDTTKVLPEFLTWYINHPNTQTYLNGAAKGTSIQSINKKTIENMLIDLPSLKYQQIILETSGLLMKEKKIRTQIIALKDQLINQQLLNAINL